MDLRTHSYLYSTEIGSKFKGNNTAENLQKKDPILAAHYSHEALLVDRKNISLFDAHIKILKNANGAVAPKEFDYLPQLFYDQVVFTRPEAITIPESSLASFSDFSNELSLASKTLLASEGDKFLLAKAYYLWGLAFAKTHPALAREAFSVATRLAQYWAYFYLELASHRLYEENDLAGAEAALRSCSEQMYAKDHCVDFSPESLPPPGAFKKEILAIP